MNATIDCIILVMKLKLNSKGCTAAATTSYFYNYIITTTTYPIMHNKKNGSIERISIYEYNLISIFT